jgi:hypothetical protein
VPSPSTSDDKISFAPRGPHCELLMTARRRCRRRGCSAISGTHEADRQDPERAALDPHRLEHRPSPHSWRSIDLCSCGSDASRLSSPMLFASTRPPAQ